jgi:pimeloyl-ACP methyl ester carboxylesterase
MADAQTRAVAKSVSVGSALTSYWLYPATTVSPDKAKSLVLVHGYRGDHHGLEAFAGGFTDYNVYVPDLPGFGESEPLKSLHNLDAYTQWLFEFLKAINLVQPIGVGHSFGTLIVSSCESEHDLFESLILVNPVGGGRGLSLFHTSHQPRWISARSTHVEGRGGNPIRDHHHLHLYLWLKRGGNPTCHHHF